MTDSIPEQIQPPPFRLAVILLVAALAVYSNCFQVPFVFDDISNIETNEAIRSLWPLHTVVENSNRPVLMLTLAFNYAFDGLNVRGYHWFNTAVHIVAGLTLFAFVRRTLLLRGIDRQFRKVADLIAFSVALIWILHPLQTQAVTYIVQRCESLMGMFFLLFLYCVVRGAQSVTPWGWYLSAVFFCWLGMGTKEVMIAAPFVMLLYDRVFLSDCWRTILRKRWHVYGICAVAQVSLLLLIPRNLVQHTDVSAGFTVEGLTAWEYLRSQPAVILHYLYLSVWPKWLCLDYMWPVAFSPLEIYGGGLVILLMLVCSLLMLRFRPRIGFATTAFFLILAPTSSIMPILDLAVEHRMYLPLIPVVVLGLLGLCAVLERLVRNDAWRRVVFTGLVLGVSVVLGVRTHARNQDYASRSSIWSDVVSQAPHNFRAHFCLGLARQEQNRLDEATAAFARAAELNPGYAKAHHSLGVVKAAQNRTVEAIAHYEQALRFSAGYDLAYRNYGNLLARQGDYEGALEKYSQAVKIRSKDASNHRVMGHTFLQLGRFQEAADAFHAAVELRPDSVPDVAWLAWLNATAPDAQVRDGATAVRLARQAVQATGFKDVGALNILAAAYAECGQFADAAATERRAVGEASASGDDELIARTEQRLRRFLDHRPLRQGSSNLIEP